MASIEISGIVHANGLTSDEMINKFIAFVEALGPDNMGMFGGSINEIDDEGNSIDDKTFIPTH